MSSDDSSSLLAELYGKWVDARRRGEFVALESLCREFPELLEPLRLKVDAAREVVTAGIQSAVSFDPNRTSLDNSLELTDPIVGLNSDEMALKPISEYVDLRFVGKGGLGVVYRAVDSQLRRDVAVKFIHRRIADDDEVRTRMRLEAEITGRLDHPGIVPVHGMGRTPSGRMFYVMRYIEGESFGAAIERYYSQDHAAEGRDLEFRSLLQRFASVCKTIAYSHDRGILHRDIKPENVMIGRFGETLVVDWGLAVPIERSMKPTESVEKTLMPGVEISSSDSAAGTPAYMSPEQAIGNMVLSPASDIYSLGATLYRILTGRAPFQGKKLFEVLDQVRLGKFPPPSKIRGDVPKPLEAVCLKAMKLDPEARYQRAMELAHDVERWLADAPVTAYADTTAAKWARWGRRHRSAVRSGVAAMAAFSLVLAGVTAMAVRYARQAEASRVEAEAAELDSLRSSADFARQSLQNQIRLRWSLLRNAAQDPELRRLLQEQNAALEMGNEQIDTPLLRDLNVVAARLRDQTADAAPCSVLSVLTADGRQAALASDDVSRASPLRPFAYRDYFHGLGRDFDEGDTKPPLGRPHLSCVFVSSTQQKLCTAFSVPVLDADSDGKPPRTIGVLAMVVDCDKLAILSGKGPAAKSALLADLRNYQLLPKRNDGTITPIRSDGLIIQHPSLTRQLTAFSEGKSDFPRLDEFDRKRLSEQAEGIVSMEDPLDAEGPVQAAFARISVDDPGASEGNHWVVVVHK